MNTVFNPAQSGSSHEIMFAAASGMNNTFFKTSVILSLNLLECTVRSDHEVPCLEATTFVSSAK